MMMKMNVQVLCDDLDQLLKDICEYLNTQTNDENLTESQRLFANKLIHRSKKQLQQISKVSMALSTDEDTSYVDMNKKSVPEFEEPTYEDGQENEYTYTPVGCGGVMIEEQITCPYETLPAANLEAEKFGNLDRKGKFLFIGHQKRLYAAKKDNWLLLYGAKKDKPLENLNLSSFIAKPTEALKTKTFELTCIKSQKTFQFVAQTPKDMIQWVACINKSNFLKEENHNEKFSKKVEDEEQNIYEQPIAVEKLDDTHTKIKCKPLPPLPMHSEKTYVDRKLPKPQLPQLDQPVEYLEAQNFDEDDQQIYDVIQDVKPQKQGKSEASKDPKKPVNIKEIVRNPEPTKMIRPDSTFTNSFSEDEDQIYDVLVIQPKPKTKVAGEEYCNLAVHGKEPSNALPTLRHLDEPDEVYCNLVPNTVNTSTLKKDSPTKQKPIEPNEEYCNLVPNATNTITIAPPEANNKTQAYNVTEEEECEDCEYDYLVSAPNTLHKRNPQTKTTVPTIEVTVNPSKKELPPLKPKPKLWKIN